MLCSPATTTTWKWIENIHDLLTTYKFFVKDKKWAEKYMVIMYNISSTLPWIVLLLLYMDSVHTYVQCLYRKIMQTRMVPFFLISYQHMNGPYTCSPVSGKGKILCIFRQLHFTYVPWTLYSNEYSTGAILVSRTETDGNNRNGNEMQRGFLYFSPYLKWTNFVR
jgi:hypothetical protein